MTVPFAAQSGVRQSPSLRVGSVSFLNAKPLIYGLGRDEDLTLSLEVPSALLGRLSHHELDVALLPVIDYQRMEGLRLLTSGGIGCDGPTLTVRIFSRIPIAEIQTLACDSDSHTSIGLARVVLAELHGIYPKFHEMEETGGGQSSGETQLLIGDKVVCEEPKGYAYQLDLGEAWKRLTGLPFVFAAWMARGGVAIRDLAKRLENAREAGIAHIEEIIQEHALPRGWPGEVARRYLTKYLQFKIGDRELEAIRLFHRLAHEHGILPHAPTELKVIRP